MNRLDVSVMQGSKRFHGRSGVRLALLAGLLLAGARAATADVLSTFNDATVNGAGKAELMLGKALGYPGYAGAIGYLADAASRGKQFGFQLSNMANVESVVSNTCVPFL